MDAKITAEASAVIGYIFQGWFFIYSLEGLLFRCKMYQKYIMDTCQLLVNFKIKIK